MAGIAMLLPDAQLCRQAEEVIKKKKHHVVYIKETTIDTVVLEARNAIAKGANIVISRGSQASAVKQHTNVPVVEIELTTQAVSYTHL